MTNQRLFIIVVICVITLIIILLNQNYESFINIKKQNQTLILIKKPNEKSKKCKVEVKEKGMKLSGSDCCIEIDEKNDYCNSKLITCSTGILGTFHYKPKNSKNHLKIQIKKSEDIKKAFKNKIDKKTLNTILELSNFDDKNTFKKKTRHKIRKITMKKAFELVDKYSKILPIQNCIKL